MDEDARKAISFVKAALIITGFLFFMFLLSGIYLLGTNTVFPATYPLYTTLTGDYVISLAAVEFFWLLMDYFLIYRRLKAQKVKDTQLACLIIGISQLLFGGIFSGIILLIAWIKIRDSVKIQKLISSENIY